nr:40s ribosomal protein s4 [Quercus suber]
MDFMALLAYEGLNKFPMVHLLSKYSVSLQRTITWTTEVVSIPKTNENFRLLCDTKGQFRLHSIRDEEAKFKLCKVHSVQFGQKGIPYLNTFDGRTIRYLDPLIKANNTIKLDLESQKITEFIKFNVGHEFTTRLGNVFTIGKGTKPWVSLTKGKGIKLPSLKKPGRGLEPKQYPQHKILWRRTKSWTKCIGRRLQSLNKRRKTLEREVAHAKVTANCVSAVVANEWKDANDKVMPVKQWLEERKFFQLRDKLAVAKRTTKAEAQLKEKHQMQFKVLEERLKTSNGNSCIASEGRTFSNGSSRR